MYMCVSIIFDDLDVYINYTIAKPTSPSSDFKTISNLEGLDLIRREQGIWLAREFIPN